MKRCVLFSVLLTLGLAQAQEIRDAFRDGWKVQRIEPIRFEVAAQAAPMFTPGGPKAWLASIERSAA